MRKKENGFSAGRVFSFFCNELSRLTAVTFKTQRLFATVDCFTSFILFKRLLFSRVGTKQGQRASEQKHWINVTTTDKKNNNDNKYKASQTQNVKKKKQKQERLHLRSRFSISRVKFPTLIHGGITWHSLSSRVSCNVVPVAMSRAIASLPVRSHRLHIKLKLNIFVNELKNLLHEALFFIKCNAESWLEDLFVANAPMNRTMLQDK